MIATAVTQLADIPSPAQGVWHLGPLPLRAYAIFIIIGIVVATLWGNRRFVARGGRPGRVTDVTVFAVPFGLVGGRLYHVITDNELYFRPGRNPWKAFAIWDGGLGIWGAIALGGLGAYIGCRYYQVSLAAYADSITPGVVVAQGIGRLGNYFNQELYGRASTAPWALDVYLRTPGGGAGSVAQCGLNPEFPTDYIKANPEVLCGTYQPTFLYELLWDLAVAALVVWADRRFKLGGGRVFWLYVAGYTLGRTWIEMLRVDTANHFLGLRINVFTSIFLFLAAIGFLYALRGRGREDPSQLSGRLDRTTAGTAPTAAEGPSGSSALDGPSGLSAADGPSAAALDGPSGLSAADGPSGLSAAEGPSGLSAAEGPSAAAPDPAPATDGAEPAEPAEEPDQKSEPFEDEAGSAVAAASHPGETVDRVDLEKQNQPNPDGWANHAVDTGLPGV